MVLQADGAGAVVLEVLRRVLVAAGAVELLLVVQHHAVVDDRDRGLAGDFAFGIEQRSFEDHIVGVPLPRLLHGVLQRGPHAVETAGLTVGVGLVVVHVEHLDLVEAMQEEPGVAAALALTLRRIRGGPFEMELEVFELLLGLDVARAFHDLEIAVLDLPRGLAVLAALPLRQVLAVEEDHGVGGCRGLMAEGLARFHDGRVRAVLVVDLPLLSRDLRGVVIADAGGEGGGRGKRQRQETRECVHGNRETPKPPDPIRKTQRRSPRRSLPSRPCDDLGTGGANRALQKTALQKTASRRRSDGPKLRAS